MPSHKPRPRSAADQAAVLTKATLRAATQLGLTNKLLVTVIGVSEATVSRMRSGDYALQRGQKSFELAVLFVRLHVASRRGWSRRPAGTYLADPRWRES